MKLQGIRVVDLSRFLPGPMLTQCMADHGADVIKIETPASGEPTRAIGEMRDGVSVFFANTQRGKRSVALDLRHPEGIEAVLRLCETADVFVEAFRPGVAQQMGLGYARVSARAPGIVYVSISAFGQTGPYSGRATHDLAIEAMAGVLSITRGQDGHPAIPGLPAADMLASMVGLSGVLMALLRRKDTGQGDYLDLAMADCVLASMANNMGSAMATRTQPDIRRARSLGGNALYALYEARCGGWVALGGQEPKFVVNLLTALQRPDLIEAAMQPPGPAQDPVRAFLREAFRSRTREEWVQFFDGRDVPFAPVQELPQALDDPHFRARGSVTTDARGWDHVTNPLRFEREAAAPIGPAPALGQHSTSVLRSLGYTDRQIARMALDGVLREASADETARHRGA